MYRQGLGTLDPMKSSQTGVNLLVLAGRNAHSTMLFLQSLPQGMHVLGVGCPSTELAGRTLLLELPEQVDKHSECWLCNADWTAADWAKVEVIYKCGEGDAVVPKEELQAQT